MPGQGQEEDQGGARIVRRQTSDLGDLAALGGPSGMKGHRLLDGMVQILLKKQGLMGRPPEAHRRQHAAGLIPQGHDLGIVPTDLPAERPAIGLIQKHLGARPVRAGLLMQGDGGGRDGGEAAQTVGVEPQAAPVGSIVGHHDIEQVSSPSVDARLEGVRPKDDVLRQPPQKFRIALDDALRKKAMSPEFQVRPAPLRASKVCEPV